ncbi:MAG: hypothetical protein K2N99_00485, partial [Malacoplasma sp.]|nr:hypothetical protein [Malacoplasma sp.]
MGSQFDSSNLMYVTKEYENLVKSKAQQIHESDEVTLTVQNINKQLDSILLEMNDKLNFVTNKLSGVGGVEDYVQGVHTNIDRVDTDAKTLISQEIEDTTSHPSIIAYKDNRSSTHFETVDFINKEIELNNDSKTLFIDGMDQLEDTDNLYTFHFNTSEEEYLKVLEFSFTYKQKPEIVYISDNKETRESTVGVSRVISGRFFLIRHDPIVKPNDFIIKAIIENSDNTGNIIDRKIVDIKEYTKTGNFNYIFDNGPQFEMYFTFNGNTNDGLNIHIGKIVPYRYVARKTYLNVDGEAVENFTFVDETSGYDGEDGSFGDIEEVYHSRNAQATVFVDRTHKRISIVNDGNNYSARAFSNASDFNYVSGRDIIEFWMKDVGQYTFIRINDGAQDTTYVCNSSIYVIKNLNAVVTDVVYLSSNEYILRVGDTYRYFDT